MKKLKVLATLLILTMVVGLLPLGALADDAVTATYDKQVIVDYEYATNIWLGDDYTNDSSIGFKNGKGYKDTEGNLRDEGLYMMSDKSNAHSFTYTDDTTGPTKNGFAGSQPIIFRWDLDNTLDPDADGVNDYEITGAYFLHKGATETDDYLTFLYDVDMSEGELRKENLYSETDSKYVYPTIIKGSNARGSSIICYKATDLDGLDPATTYTNIKSTISSTGISTDSYTFAVDLTSYVNGKDSNDFAFLMTSNRQHASKIVSDGVNDKPKLYLELKEVPLAISAYPTLDIESNYVEVTVNESEKTLTALDVYINDAETPAKTLTDADVNGKKYLFSLDSSLSGALDVRVVATYADETTDEVTENINFINVETGVVLYNGAFTYDSMASSTQIANWSTSKNYNTGGISPKTTSTTNLQTYHQFPLDTIKARYDEIDKIYLCVGFLTTNKILYQWCDNSNVFNAAPDSANAVPKLYENACESYLFDITATKSGTSVAWDVPNLTVDKTSDTETDKTDSVDYTSVLSPYSTNIYMNTWGNSGEAYTDKKDSFLGCDPYYGVTNTQTMAAVDATDYILAEAAKTGDDARSVVILNGSSRLTGSATYVKKMPWLYIQYKSGGAPELMEKTDDTITVSVNTADYSTNNDALVNVICATYDENGKLINNNSIKYAKPSIAMTRYEIFDFKLPSKAKKYALFIWEDGTLKPLNEAVKTDIE